MRAYILGGLLLCGIAAGTASMAAHHSFTAEFDGNKKVTMTGIVTKVEWTNPHVWFYINVKDEKTGEWLTRGDMSIAFLDTWKAARIPAADTIRALTINGYKAADVIKDRGPIKPGLYADLIAVAGDPLTDIDVLRSVQFVMKNGMVFKRDGVMTPEKFFHPGPVRTPNGRWTR